MAGTLEEAVRQLVSKAKSDGSTIYTDEAVKRLRAELPELTLSSASMTDHIIRAACADGVPLRMAVPLEIR